MPVTKIVKCLKGTNSKGEKESHPRRQQCLEEASVDVKRRKEVAYNKDST